MGLLGVQLCEVVCVCVLVHYFDGVDVKGRGGGGASGLTGGSLVAGDSLTPGELSCYCLANSELSDRVVSFHDN